MARKTTAEKIQEIVKRKTAFNFKVESKFYKIQITVMADSKETAMDAIRSNYEMIDTISLLSETQFTLITDL